MKAYVTSLILLLFSVTAFAQQQLAIGDTTAPYQPSRVAVGYDNNAIPYTVQKGKLPKRNAFYADIPAVGNTLYPQLSLFYDNPAWLRQVAWSKITGTPNTLAGYGITDGVNTTQLNQKADKATTLAGYGITNAESFIDVDTWDQMNAVVVAANKYIRVRVKIDNHYNNDPGTWYKVFAGADGVVHSDREVVIHEK